MEELTWEYLKSMRAQFELTHNQIEAQLGDTADYTAEHAHLSEQLVAMHDAIQSLRAYMSARAKFERLKK